MKNLCIKCNGRTIRTTKDYKPALRCKNCNIVFLKEKTRTITIKEIESEEGKRTNFIVDGYFSDFEKIGMLEYYKNALLTTMLLKD